MITGLDDLIVSLGTDAGMIAAMVALFTLGRRWLRAMVKRFGFRPPQFDD